MCGRIFYKYSLKELRIYFPDLQIPFSQEQFPANYNLAPAAAIPVIHQSHHGLALNFFTWGLIPSWSKNVPTKPLFNARTETIYEKPSFRDSYRYRRCIVPVSGFFEWKALAKEKKPYVVTYQKPKIMFLAGIWDHWMHANGSEVLSVSVLTTGANALLQEIHHRMPVLLAEKDFSDWWKSPQTADSLLVPAPIQGMHKYRSNPIVNRSTSNSPACIAEDSEMSLFPE
ncbi:MAG: SOS response-associated peptidase [Spirochaetota bacterium]